MSLFFEAASRCNPELIRRTCFATEKAFDETRTATLQRLASTVDDDAMSASGYAVASIDRIHSFESSLAEARRRNQRIAESKLRSTAHEINVYAKKGGTALTKPPICLDTPFGTQLPTGGRTHVIDAVQAAARQKLLDEILNEAKLSHVQPLCIFVDALEE